MPTITPSTSASPAGSASPSTSASPAGSASASPTSSFTPVATLGADLLPDQLPVLPEPAFAEMAVNSVNECANVLIENKDIPSSLRAFAIPFSPKGTGELLMGVFWSGDTVEASIGNDDPATYVSRNAYLAKGNTAWQSIALEGDQPIANGWYAGSAHATLPVKTSELNQYHFLIAYMCHWQDGKWQCGCDGQKCENSKWNIQAFSKN